MAPPPFKIVNIRYVVEDVVVAEESRLPLPLPIFGFAAVCGISAAVDAADMSPIRDAINGLLLDDDDVPPLMLPVMSAVCCVSGN